MPIPVQSFATTPLGNPQQQLRNRIAMQMMGRLGAPGATAPRPAAMSPLPRGYVDPNPQAMQQQRALQAQQQQALGELFDPRTR